MMNRLFAAAVVLTSLHSNTHAAPPVEPLKLVQSITMPNLRGRFDHLALDAKRNRVYVAALADNQIIVLDADQSRLRKVIPSISQPQGLMYLADFDLVVATSGGQGRCVFFDPESLETVHSVDAKRNADNLRYDDATRTLYMGYGQANGVIAVIDPATANVLREIPLPAHPEAFEIERNTKRMFVNIATLNQVAVVDRESGQTIAIWTLPPEVHGNFPMALDEANHRLFIATRKPSRLLVYDTERAKLVATYPIITECDDLFYDGVDKRIYASCGGGTIDVFTQQSPDQYQLLARIPISLGARTSLLVPNLRRFFIVAPASREVESSLLEYRVMPSEAPATGSAVSTAPAAAGNGSVSAPAKVTFDFDHDDLDRAPPGWKIESTNRQGPLATWQVKGESKGAAPSGHLVLALTESKSSGESFNICWTDAAQFRDGQIEVSVKPVTGTEDQGGGPIWRAKDKDNYYIARLNPLEKNFRVYVVKDGKHTMLGSAESDAAAGQWHTIKINQDGDHVTCALDGKPLLDAHDNALPDAGGVGVWTKADAATWFDSLVVSPR